MSIINDDFFGLKVSIFSKEDLNHIIIDSINSKNSSIFYGYSLAVLSYLKNFPHYHKITSQFDLFVTDGRLFYLLARAFGVKLKYDISIPRLTLLTLELANQSNTRLLLIGASESSNRKANENIKVRYPAIEVITGLNGFEDIIDKRTVFDYVRKTKPNVLLLGLPTPLKQELALELRPIVDNCIIIPCGGMIDVLAGKEKLTPNWIKKIGLASLYRHIQHPNRLPELFSIYFKTLTTFSRCAYLFFIKREKSISIPNMISRINT